MEETKIIMQCNGEKTKTNYLPEEEHYKEGEETKTQSRFQKAKYNKMMMYEKGNNCKLVIIYKKDKPLKTKDYSTLNIFFANDFISIFHSTNYRASNSASRTADLLRYIK